MDGSCGHGGLRVVVDWGMIRHIAPSLVQGNGNGYSEVSDWWWVWERVDRELQST